MITRVETATRVDHTMIDGLTISVWKTTINRTGEPSFQVWETRIGNQVTGWEILWHDSESTARAHAYELIARETWIENQLDALTL